MYMSVCLSFPVLSFCSMEFLAVTTAVLSLLVLIVQGYRLQCDRKARVIDVPENSQIRLTCSDVSANHDVAWRKRDPSDGNWRLLGTCSPSTCRVADNRYFITRPSATESQLTILTDSRDVGVGEIQCFLENTVRYDWCVLRAVYPAHTFSDCRVEVSADGRTVFGTCYVDKVFASDNDYTCHWYQHYNLQSETILPGRVQFVPYVETATGQEYSRGTCVFQAPLVCVPGNFTYSVTVSPGLHRVPVGRVHVERPSKGSHQRQSTISVFSKTVASSGTEDNEAEGAQPMTGPTQTGFCMSGTKAGFEHGRKATVASDGLKSRVISYRGNGSSRSPPISVEDSFSHAHNGSAGFCDGHVSLMRFLWSSFSLLCIVIIFLCTVGIRKLIALHRKRIPRVRNRKQDRKTECCHAPEVCLNLSSENGNNVMRNPLSRNYLTPCFEPSVYETIEEETLCKEAGNRD